VASTVVCCYLYLYEAYWLSLNPVDVYFEEQLTEPRPRLLAQYLIPSGLEQLPEGVEESDLFGAYASDCVYNEREVEL